MDFTSASHFTSCPYFYDNNTFLFFLLDLQNIFVHLSSPAFFNNIVRLKCSVDTNQPVAYKWFKNNITLDASRDSRLQVLPSGVLRIRDYRVSDDGSYFCRAENAYKAINSREVTVAGQCKFDSRIYSCARDIRAWLHELEYSDGRSVVLDFYTKLQRCFRLLHYVARKIRGLIDLSRGTN